MDFKIRFTNDIYRPMLHLKISPGQILPNDSDAQQLDPPKKSDEASEARPSTHRIAEHNRLHDNPDRKDKRKNTADDANPRSERKRCG